MLRADREQGKMHRTQASAVEHHRAQGKPDRMGVHRAKALSKQPKNKGPKPREEAKAVRSSSLEGKPMPSRANWRERLVFWVEQGLAGDQFEGLCAESSILAVALPGSLLTGVC